MSIKLTPKRVAQAIGVSESSMKRWCDRGLIKFQKTAGGHRRISKSSVVEFLRKSEHPIVAPEFLGLPPGLGRSQQAIPEARQQYQQAVFAGDEQQCHRILMGLYLAEKSIAEIGDDVVLPNLTMFGQPGTNGDGGVQQQSRARDISLRALMELRGLLPQLDPAAPLAIGGTPEADTNILSTTLIEMAFQEMGWHSRSLGAEMPFATLALEARRQNPRLFWLSVSSITNDSEFVTGYEHLMRSLSPTTDLVISGRAWSDSLRQRLKFSAFAANLTQIQSLAQSLKPGASVAGQQS